MNAIKIFVLVLALAALAAAALNVTLSDQGTTVKSVSTGNLLALGNLSVLVYDAATAGNLVYNETFLNAIYNGSWNVMIGDNASNPLALNFNQPYYKEYTIQGEDVDFENANGSTTERMRFFAPLGTVNYSHLASFPAYCSGQTVVQGVNLTLSCFNVAVFNDTNAINALNATKGVAGTCAVGTVVQNVSNETTPACLNLAAWNDTALINAVNTTANIQNLNFYNTTQIDALISSANQSGFNDTNGVYLYYGGRMLYFNDTRLNSTIDARGAVFNDTLANPFTNTTAQILPKAGYPQTLNITVVIAQNWTSPLNTSLGCSWNASGCRTCVSATVTEIMC